MNNYHEIKNLYEKLINILITKNTEELKTFVYPEVLCFFNVSKYGDDGFQHSLYGLKDFIIDIPKIESLEILQGDYICHINKDKTEAKQYGNLFYKASKKDQYFECSIVINTKWKLENKQWRLNEIRCDIINPSGDLIEEYQQFWVFREFTNRVNCAEIDFPWEYKVAPDLSDAEIIEDIYSNYIMCLNYYDYETLSSLINVSNEEQQDFIFKMYDNYLRGIPSFNLLKRIKIAITNETANVTAFNLRNKNTQTIKFIKVNNEWKINNFEELCQVTDIKKKVLITTENSDMKCLEIHDVVNSIRQNIENLRFSSLSNQIDYSYGINALHYGRKEGYRELITKIKKYMIDNVGKKFPYEIKDIIVDNNHAYLKIYPLFNHKTIAQYGDKYNDNEYACGKYEIEFIKRKDTWRLSYIYGNEGLYRIK